MLAVSLLLGLALAKESLVNSTAYGASFRSFLTKNYAEHTHLGYKRARLEMYGFIYNNPLTNAVTCVYTGRELDCPYMTEETNCNEDLNCEHVVPQSLFDSLEPIKSDLHHLYPALAAANSARSNYPFDNIPTENVSAWYGKNNITEEPPRFPNRYSKVEKGVCFEPRDAVKGKIARAVAYFFVAYPDYFDRLGDVMDVDTLLHWNVLHPPTAEELDEHDRIVTVQGNKNPFVVDHLWMVRAYCDVSSWGCQDFEGVSAESSEYTDVEQALRG
ncbi:Endonuclease I [Giardia duodenalis]|uniref:Endonuclease I n=1 Tax=Giardia intestinalis TaxID=5741 RepID=V6TDT0_GIAIN|nr:Endonuclease I [Giardia intestinalis]